MLLCCGVGSLPQRDWLESQAQVPVDLATWPEHLYEHFFVVVSTSPLRPIEWPYLNVDPGQPGKGPVGGSVWSLVGATSCTRNPSAVCLAPWS